MEFTFLINEQSVEVVLEKKDDKYYYTVKDKEAVEVDIRDISSHMLSFLIEGNSHRVYLASDGDKYYGYFRGRHFVVQESSYEKDQVQRGEERSLEEMLIIRAPMPGKIIQINVEEGQEVRKNQTLAIVEAMKMENEIKSGMEAVVKKILIEDGDLVDSDKVLIELEALNNT